MRSLIFAFCLFALFALVASATGDYAALFNEFKTKHGRTYASKSEEAKRFGIFADNMKIADAYTKLNPQAQFGVNAYADYSAAEFKTYHNGNAHFQATTKARGVEVQMSEAQTKAAAGQKIDWRTKGAVTHVKNQGDCGSCWSFSTTGGIEGQWKLAGNPLTSLSEQELVSCDTIDKACQGGIMQNAFKWLMANRDGKLVTAASYPYVSGQGNVPACDMTGKTFGAQISGHVDVTKTESAMATWVFANGPLSIAVDATTWQTYTGGIMTNCASTAIDHGVLIVGYDDTNATPYWIIKNSWGPSWGESGYIRVQKGTDQCLITGDPTSSTVSSSGPHPPAPTSSPNSPPQPPAPTSAPASPSGATFTQKTCTDSTCASGCQSHSFPQNTCLSLTGGGSAKATCTSTDLTLTEYPTSTSCSGFSIPTTQPINQCVQDNSGSYLENLCSGSGLAALKGEKLATSADLAAKVAKLMKRI